jgi:hypothetical protein
MKTRKSPKKEENKKIIKTRKQENKKIKKKMVGEQFIPRIFSQSGW